MSNFKPEKIHRIIIKISGEFLAGEKGFGFDYETIDRITDELINIRKMGISIGVVLGGGNFFRGGSADKQIVSRISGDNVGMLATVQNSLVLADMLRKKNYDAEVFSAIQMDKICQFYSPEQALRTLQKRRICFICAGTGNPYFTTDTAAVLRAIELRANLVIKGTKVDGVFSADPEKDEKAKFIADITYDEVISRRLNVMDMTAFSLARENDMQIKVFNVLTAGALEKTIFSDEIGTFIHS